jgi:hypothetical protein
MSEKSRLAGAVTLAVLTGLLLSGCGLLGPGNSTEGDPDGSVTAGDQDADVFSIRVGDCLNDAGATGAVRTAPIVSCDEPHDSEAFASFQLDDGDFPGDDEVLEAGRQLCYDAFETFVGVVDENSIYSYTSYVPTAGSWTDRGDREVLCTIYDPSGEQVTGTLENIGM